MRFEVSSMAGVLVLIAACVPVQAQDIAMARTTPWAEDADVSRKVRDECTKLQEQLPAYTREFAAEFGIDVDLVDQVASDAPGRALHVEIEEAVSMGNAFIGHRKYSQVRGALYEDGAPVASFKAMRASMGGAFAGYKGSCSVLGRTIKALGKDIATWLKDPEDGAELGDM
jgi:hypothetical protein